MNNQLVRFCSILLLFIVLNQLKAQAIYHWETAVYSTDQWRYFVGNKEPDKDWRNKNFNDTIWPEDHGGFGYSDNDDITIIEPCYSVFIRNTFKIVDTSKILAAILSIDYDDAFIAYLNDVEIARAGISGIYPAYNTTGTDHEAKIYSGGKPEDFIISKQKLLSCILNGKNVLAIQVHNTSLTSSDLSATAFLSFGLPYGTTYFRPTPQWFQSPDDSKDFLELASNLPIVSITTFNNQTIPGVGTKINAMMRIIDGRAKALNHLTDSANDYYGNIGIEIRGSTSAAYDQKSYNIETRDNILANKNTSLLGMPAENDWALIANYNDKSFVRNTLTHQLFASMGHYAPRTRFCEVFINNDYKGIYFLAEKIKRDDNRVNITKPDPKFTSGDNLSGGYIFKNDNKDSDEDVFFSNFNEQGKSGTNQISFIYVEPKSNEITYAQKNYISNFVNSFEKSLYGSDFADPFKGYQAYIDMNSFVDYFIIGEVSRSVDAYKKSKFFFKDIDSKGGLLQSGPTWDFDWAYKNIPEGDEIKECYYGVTNGSGWAYKAINCNHSPPFPGWTIRLMQDPNFVNKIKTRYVDLRKTILSQSSIYQYIDSVQLKLFEPQKRHYKKWNILGKNSLGAPEVDPQPTSFESVELQLKNWIDTRLTWLDNNMPGTYLHNDPTTSTTDQTVVFRIFPNPTHAHIYFESDKKIEKIEFYSFAGIKVFSQKTFSNSVAIDLVNMHNGFYVVKTFFETGAVMINRLLVE